jgi:hypothetical protein
VLEDKLASERVKAEARWEQGEILEFLRENPWRSQDGAQKCVRAVTKAIKRGSGLRTKERGLRGLFQERHNPLQTGRNRFE